MKPPRNPACMQQHKIIPQPTVCLDSQGNKVKSHTKENHEKKYLS